MAQLELTRQAAKLAHIAFPPKGKENDDKTIPVALKFTVEEGADWLAHFHPRLADSFYMADDNEQEPLAGVERGRTKRVFGDLIGGFHLSTELTGATGKIFHGVKSEIHVDLATVKNFKVVVKEGGTVQVEFLVLSRFPSKDVKTLAELKEGDVEISLGMAQGEMPLDD